MHDGRLPIDLIRDPNPRNPRRSFAPRKSLATWLNRSGNTGIVQPVVVRPTGREGRHEIICGRAPLAGCAEGRPYRGARHHPRRQRSRGAGTRHRSRTCSAPISIPSKEAAGYQPADRTSTAHTSVPILGAQVIGKSRSHVANTLRPAEVVGWLSRTCWSTVRSPPAIAPRPG